MKLFTAGLMTETSDLTPIPLTMDDWMIENPGDPIESASFLRNVLLLFKRLAQEKGWTVAESICATSFPPGGRSIRSAYESMRDKILEDLEQALPVDAVLLGLHGAAMAHGYDDCEGDLLAHIRQKVGPDVPIGVELDPHCHLTEQMIGNATLIALYKTFRHTDIEDIALELFDLMAGTLAGDIKPTMALFDCQMMDSFDDQLEPMKSFLARVRQEEKKPGILSISPVHGFGMADIPEMGAKMLVITDNDSELAKATAESLGIEFFEARGQMGEPGPGDIAAKLDIAQARLDKGDKAIQLLEWSDLPGCGFPADSTEVLKAMLERNMCNMAVGPMWDPMAVSICQNLGEGEEVLLRIGGKASSLSGEPIDLKVRVMRLEQDYVVNTLSGESLLGDVAVVRAGETELLLVSNRLMYGGVEAFRAFGIEPEKKDYLLLKYDREPDSTIDVFGSSLNYKNWPFTQISRPKYPWDKTISLKHQQ